MAARESNRLVIDASVARAAGGEDAVFPRSKHCRDFLKATLVICHRVVLTPEIGEEWKQHRSNFARRWLGSMMARKKVHLLGNVVNDELRGRVERAAAHAGNDEREAMRKDFLLIEAAIATDRIVISLDDTAKGLFAVAARSVGELKNIAWVNPGQAEEQPILWLENGAKSETPRLLGSQAGGNR